MKINKKIACISLFLSSLVVIEVKAEDVLVNGFPPIDAAKILSLTSPEVGRVIQFQSPIRSFSTEYVVSKSDDGGSTWAVFREHKFTWDKTSDSMIHRVKNSFDKITTETIKTGNVVMIKESKVGSEEWATVNIQKSDRACINMSSFPIELVYYSCFIGDIPIVRDGKFTTEPSRFSLVKHDGADKLLYQLIPALPEETSAEEWMALFDSKTGYLSQKTLYTRNVGEKTKVTRTLRKSVSVKDYFLSNGVPFPAELVYRYGKTPRLDGKTIYRYKINREKTKINEKIDKKVFRTTLPPGAFVADQIQDKAYFAPSIGNTEAEAQIVKDLDELFKKANQ